MHVTAGPASYRWPELIRVTVSICTERTSLCAGVLAFCVAVTAQKQHYIHVVHDIVMHNFIHPAYGICRKQLTIQIAGACWVAVLGSQS